MVIGSMLRIVILFMLVSLPALARDNGQWGNQPAYLREWFQKLMQPDNPHMSCCGEADAFEADSFEVSGDEYVAIITNGKGVRGLVARVASAIAPTGPNLCPFEIGASRRKWSQFRASRCGASVIPRLAVTW